MLPPEDVTGLTICAACGLHQHPAVFRRYIDRSGTEPWVHGHPDHAPPPNVVSADDYAMFEPEPPRRQASGDHHHRWSLHRSH